MGMHDTGRYRPGQDSWRAYGQVRDDRDPPWEGTQGDQRDDWRDSRDDRDNRGQRADVSRRQGSDLRYGLNGGYGQETWADDDASWSDVADDDWGELKPHMFRNRNQERPQPRGQYDRQSARGDIGYEERRYASDTHYDELRSDRRYWTEPGYGSDDGGQNYRGNYRDDARRAFERGEDYEPEDYEPENRGVLYNLGHRIGEAIGEWFGPSTDERPGARRAGPRNYQRTDERIRDEICERLTFTNGVNVREVSVEVEKGVVTLSGTVERRSQKYDIEDIADNTFGVTEVDNRIRVQRQSTNDAVDAGFNGW